MNLNSASYQGYRNYILLFFILWALDSCSGDKDQQVMFIEEETLLDSIPSASGMVIKDSMAFIIGDDATSIYKFHVGDRKRSGIPFGHFDNSLYRLPKPVKHDFESGTLMKWNDKDYLLAFGSGSGGAARDSMLVLNITDFNDQKIIPLSVFYKKLRQILNTDSTQWNIEGAATVNQYLFLCNRGNNMIIKIEATGFMNYLSDTAAAFPPVKYYQLELPSIQNKQARLSGACALQNGDILLSASVEDTPDWMSDGPVLGSYVCIYSTSKNKINASFLLQDGKGQPLKEKLETVEILHNEPLTVVALSDNDGGDSKLFRLVIK